MNDCWNTKQLQNSREIAFYNIDICVDIINTFPWLILVPRGTDVDM